MLLLAGLLLLISLFHAWRYSKTSVDPDWAYFNLWGFTGSVYGKDFADCKTPAIHLWYLLLVKIVGKDVKRVKFLHHFLLGSVGVLVYVFSGNFWYGLTYTVLVNSGWLLAFHGNVGQHPAAFIALAFAVNDPIVSPLLWLGALAFEPKLLPSFFVLFWKWFLVLAPLGLLFYFVFRNQQWFKWVWESSVTLPKRIGLGRKGLYEWMPWYSSNGLLYTLPMIGTTAYFTNTNWIPVFIYLAVLFAGRAVRQNHFLPLIAWVSLPPFFAVMVCLVDFISAGGYFGNLWSRFYGALNELNEEARRVGEYLKKLSGTIYVNGIHSAIYIYAQKPVQFGFVEQIEIRENAHERRTKMIENWKASPPDWVVVGVGPGVKFKPVGYRKVEQIGESLVFRKV